jgi:type I restriction enzyme, S subunit
LSELNGLPEGWITAQLADIADIIMGQSPPSAAYNEEEEGLPFFQGKAEFTDMRPVVRKWCSAPTKIAGAGDVLLSVRAPVGPTNLAPSRCCIGRGLAAIRALDGVESRYILYAIRAFQTNLSDLATGTTFEAVTGDVVRSFEIPVAPQAEQRRIVAAIEEQFSRLDAGVSVLERARTNLKRYRTAVIKAAVEGRLTEDWREENLDVEPASELLERILKERRERWERDQLAAFEKKGKKPPKNWRSKYKKPAGPKDPEVGPVLLRRWGDVH